MYEAGHHSFDRGILTTAEQGATDDQALHPLSDGTAITAQELVVPIYHAPEFGPAERRALPSDFDAEAPIGHTLNSLRDQKKMSIAEVAGKLGVSRQTLTRLFMGDTHPNERAVQGVLRVLGVSGEEADALVDAYREEASAHATAGGRRLPTTPRSVLPPENSDEPLSPRQRLQAISQKLQHNDIPFDSLLSGNAQLLRRALPVILENSELSDPEIAGILGVAPRSVSTIRIRVIQMALRNAPVLLQEYAETRAPRQTAETPDSVAARIKEIIAAAGIRRAELVVKLGIDDSTLNRYLGGKSYPQAAVVVVPLLDELTARGILSSADAQLYREAYIAERKQRSPSPEILARLPQRQKALLAIDMVRAQQTTDLNPWEPIGPQVSALCHDRKLSLATLPRRTGLTDMAIMEFFYDGSDAGQDTVEVILRAAGLLAPEIKDILYVHTLHQAWRQIQSGDTPS